MAMPLGTSTLMRSGQLGVEGGRGEDGRAVVWAGQTPRPAVPCIRCPLSVLGAGR